MITDAPQRVLDELTRALGPALVTDPAALAPLRADRSGHSSPAAPLALVEARSVEDVQATLRIANAHGVPVVPRGAGTGLAGGAIAGEDELVLSTLAMNRILEVDPVDEIAVVEPGILNGAFNDALAEHGLWFAPDPASRAISTVGGNIATNAGGLLCAKYGVTREAVLGLDVVLADGTLLRVGRRSLKGVTGLDLTGLFVGSEGTLGVIVGATVRVRPRVSGAIATIGAWFPDVHSAASACTAVGATRVRPAVLELMDAASLAAIAGYLGPQLEPKGAVYVLAQADGPAAASEADTIADALRASGGIVEATTDAAEGERLLAVRRSAHPAYAALGSTLIEDVCVPRSKLAAMFDAIGDIERRYGLTIPTLAHAGDGNLHPNFIFGEPGSVTTEVPEEIWRAADDLFRSALQLGGTLTGEHGVGILKKRWLADELGERQVDLQRDLRRVFDPRGILNPGKVF
ncbi:FAD-binding oxidoreductase [Herbiconiux sp. SYSU D00978]|uniref:FAD-binding oxidoreductase n=1 Tax=Herbiconiux sp. SYSU D00978 TaxID=2812562 RepID=UPI001A965A19|nr:FAD-linked oxidase C-terminal domain-containing protein [Herbiconiux sp. SYSU D00978]